MELNGLLTFIAMMNQKTFRKDSQFHGEQHKRVILPVPKFDSNRSLESTLLERRSIRDFLDNELSLAEVSQLLWAAIGETDPEGHRTAPSAGALYPLELYCVSGNVQDLPHGIYRYDPHKHQLDELIGADKRPALSSAALSQDFIRKAAVSMVISAIYERTTWKYGKRGERYVHMEVGHIAQNISLQAEALDLGTVVVGAFNDSTVKDILNMPENEHPLCIMPVGRTR